MDTRAYTYNLGLAFYNISETYNSNAALRYPTGEEYSYKEINNISNKLSRFLLDTGIAKGDVIAIFNDKSLFAYSLMIACLKAGIIYTNIDTTSPWQRIHKILNTCLPKAIFHENTSYALISQAEAEFTDTSFF